MAIAVTTILSTITTSVAASASSAAANASATDRAQHQGILQHGNPIIWSASDPITLFIVQASLIVITCRLLHYPLKLIRQPRVISEVIAGIVLGPTVMGHIPGFSAAIFPTAGGALAPLNLVANLGLVFFLFLVGLEVDLRFLASQWKTAATVGALGMVIPFGAGAGLAWGIYNQFHDDPGLVPIPFGTFMLFVGIAMAITAFPVLCRILTELKLIHTPVGIVALSAGVANDVVGWILLALCVALVNASEGLTALYIILVAIGFILFLIYPVRIAFIWFLKRHGAISNGPSQSIVALVMMMVLVSAWFTNVIGIHAIFGAFLVGLIIPHEGGFAIKITEKIEDFVSGIFVPIYFTLSGLNTNIGLLNDGITWAYVIAIIIIAFVAKILGGTLASRLTGRRWRESLAIGVLMSCKGLVELIVLNIGYNAKILSQRTFTMFVVMALVTTFATTPLVRWLYPPSYQQKLEAWRRGDTDYHGKSLRDEKDDNGATPSALREETEVNKLAVYLRLDTLPGVLTLVALFARHSSTEVEAKLHPSKQKDGERSSVVKRPFEVQGIRLKEVDDRDSSIMEVSNFDDEAAIDPILNTFRTFLSQIVQVAVQGIVLRCLPDSYAASLLDCAKSVEADMLLLAWSPSGSMSDAQTNLVETTPGRFANGFFSNFMTKTLSRSSNYKTATFIDNGFGYRRRLKKTNLTRTRSSLSLHNENNSGPSAPLQDLGHHVFLPFFGTKDDVAALHLVLQLARDPAVTATICHFELPDSIAQVEAFPVQSGKTPSSTATAISVHSFTVFNNIRDSLPADLVDRVVFESISLASNEQPLESAITKAKTELGQNPKNAGDLLVLGRNLTESSVRGTLPEWEHSEAGKTLGPLAGAALATPGKIGASLLVIGAATSTPEQFA